MTHAELEAVENGARSATAYGAEPDDTPLPKKIINGVTGIMILAATAVVLLILVIWRSH
jgi:hypothetical protein